MVQMSMNRVIHAAVRRDLDRFCAALDSFAPGDGTRAEGLWRAWAHFELMLGDHHEGEHEIVWPVLVELGADPALLDTMDTEHDAMAAALADSSSAMANLRERVDQPAAEAAANAMGQLSSVTVHHLDHEEDQLEELFLTNEGSPELKAMSRRLRGDANGRPGDFFAWLQHGASDAENRALASIVPVPVLFLLSRLGGRRYWRTVAPVWAA